MPQFFTLASSSSGNASCFLSAKGNFLLDCGVSACQILSRLADADVNPADLSGILITHEHEDHVKGLKVFLKKHPLPVFASGAVLKKLKADGKLTPEIPCIEVIPGVSFAVGEINVTPFATSHDSVGALCYYFSFGERSAAVLTDTGFASHDMLEAVSGANLILLESNYDPDSLKNGSYPASLKDRIGGHFGHLSNDQAAELAAKLFDCGTTRFVLGHLSRENNDPEFARLAVKTALDQIGGKEGYNYQLLVAPPDHALPICIF